MTAAQKRVNMLAGRLLVGLGLICVGLVLILVSDRWVAVLKTPKNPTFAKYEEQVLEKETSKEWLQANLVSTERERNDNDGLKPPPDNPEFAKYEAAMKEVDRSEMWLRQNLLLGKALIVDTAENQALRNLHSSRIDQQGKMPEGYVLYVDEHGGRRTRWTNDEDAPAEKSPVKPRLKENTAENRELLRVHLEVRNQEIMVPVGYGEFLAKHGKRNERGMDWTHPSMMIFIAGSMVLFFGVTILFSKDEEETDS